MKETLQAMDWNSIIKKYFVELVDVVKSGLDFASKEVPLYLKELIAYEFWHAVVWGIVYAIFMIISIWALRKFYARLRAEEGQNSDNPIWVFSCIGMLVSSIIFGINSINEADTAIKAAVAPRLVIVEKIQVLIKDTANNSCINR